MKTINQIKEIRNTENRLLNIRKCLYSVLKGAGVVDGRFYQIFDRYTVEECVQFEKKIQEKINLINSKYDSLPRISMKEHLLFLADQK